MTNSSLVLLLRLFVNCLMARAPSFAWDFALEKKEERRRERGEWLSRAVSTQNPTQNLELGLSRRFCFTKQNQNVNRNPASLSWPRNHDPLILNLNASLKHHKIMTKGGSWDKLRDWKRAWQAAVKPGKNWNRLSSCLLLDPGLTFSLLLWNWKLEIQQPQVIP